MENKDQQRTLTGIMERMLEDNDFRQEMLASPLEVLGREGIEVPPEAEEAFLSRLQEFPAEGLPQAALEDEALSNVVGGVGRDRNKPCRNSTCREEYGSSGCWVVWLFHLGLCTEKNFRKR